MKILILGGTKEAGALAAQLVEGGHDVTSSLAGRTKEPKPLAGKVRIGGFGGADGLSKYLVDHQIEKLIDATHPFAKQISENANAAAQATGVEFEVITRKPWQKQEDDIWIKVASLQEARDLIPENSRVLLALGSQYIDQFSKREDVFFLVRMVDKPDQDFPLPNHELLIGKPSADWQQEAKLIEQKKINHIICRNSGGTGAYAKIEAARKLGIPVIMVGR